ncbi:MAG: hypothetical protein ACI4CX_00045 [Candidatus Weimeria sp.]
MMNKQQMEYLKAKKALSYEDRQQQKNEREFLRVNGYRNQDGSVPEEIYLYDNDAKFDQCWAEFEVSEYNHYALVREAQARLHKAEEGLIDYALSLMPAFATQYKLELEKERNNPKIREKLIDLAFRLDPGTESGGVDK